MVLYFLFRKVLRAERLVSKYHIKIDTELFDGTAVDVEKWIVSDTPMFGLTAGGSKIPNVFDDNVEKAYTTPDPTRTIDDVILDRLRERSDRMFRLMNDSTRLVPLDLETDDYKINGKTQIFDGQEGEEGIIRKKILDMIKRHHQKQT